jgi:uncharacterized cupredoxin-like copper-binding protein
VHIIRWRGYLPALLLLTFLLGLLAACGAPDASMAGAGGFSTDNFPNQVQVAADPKGALKWDKTTYEAKAGAVTFVVANTSPITHNFIIEGNGVRLTSKNFRGQNPEFLSVANLAAGEYQIICTIPGHREGGMVAKLIVK